MEKYKASDELKKLNFFLKDPETSDATIGLVHGLIKEINKKIEEFEGNFRSNEGYRQIMLILQSEPRSQTYDWHVKNELEQLIRDILIRDISYDDGDLLKWFAYTHEFFEDLIHSMDSFQMIKNYGFWEAGTYCDEPYLFSEHLIYLVLAAKENAKLRKRIDKIESSGKDKEWIKKTVDRLTWEKDGKSSDYFKEIIKSREDL
jgi:hypothetical protein